MVSIDDIDGLSKFLNESKPSDALTLAKAYTLYRQGKLTEAIAVAKTGSSEAFLHLQAQIVS